MILFVVAALAAGSNGCGRDDERELKRTEAKIVAALPPGATFVGTGVGNRKGNYRSSVYEVLGDRDAVERQICDELASQKITCGPSALDPANQIHVDPGIRYYVDLNFKPGRSGRTRFEVFTYIED